MARSGASRQTRGHMRRSPGRRGAPGRRSLAKVHSPAGEAPRGLLSCHADVPRELVRFVCGLLAAHRREIGTRKGTRRLTCYKQALFGLAWFRDKGDIPRLGRGFGLAQSTAYRYPDEVIEVLAARAPGLREALGTPWPKGLRT
jgi:hypothetical protein